MSATIFPTGVTIYNPEKCWSGYTILQAAERGALLIDMNGNEVRMWEGLQGFPNKMLPGGYVMGSLGERNPKYGLQDQTDRSLIILALYAIASSGRTEPSVHTSRISLS